MPTRTLKDRIQDDIKDAMRERAADRLLALRGLMAAIKQREVDDRTTLDDAGVVALIDKVVKQRRDSIAAFRQGGRDDLVAKEEAEAALLQAYLPERLSTDAVAAEVAMLVSELGATGAADMGRVMAAAKARFAGRAEMGAVSAAVKAALARSAAP
jgi:uncharacterized protein YqeY